MDSHSKRNVGRPVPGTNRRRLDGKPSGKTDRSGARKLGEKFTEKEERTEKQKSEAEEKTDIPKRKNRRKCWRKNDIQKKVRER